MFFARAEDPGLLVLPTHRLVRNLAPEVLAALRAKAAPWFEVEEGTETSAAAIEARLAREGGQRVTLALREAGRAGTTWFGLRPEADLSLAGAARAAGAGRDRAARPAAGAAAGRGQGSDGQAVIPHLHPRHRRRRWMRLARGPRPRRAFFMNPTQVDQVLQACEAGFVLPQKSTYFQPKLATGLVMARIDPARAPARVL